MRLVYLYLLLRCFPPRAEFENFHASSQHDVWNIRFRVSPLRFIHFAVRAEFTCRK